MRVVQAKVHSGENVYYSLRYKPDADVLLLGLLLTGGVSEVNDFFVYRTLVASATLNMLLNVNDTVGHHGGELTIVGSARDPNIYTMIFMKSSLVL